MSSIYTLLSIISLSVCLAAYAEERDWHDEANTPRAEAARVAVVQWCDARSGQFLLRNGHPFCIVFDSVEGITNVFKGEWRTEIGDAPEYWWQIRTAFSDEPTLRAAVLWVVDPDAYTPIVVSEEQSELTGTDTVEVSPEVAKWAHLTVECMLAQKALNNPARALVSFIGIDINECIAHSEQAERRLLNRK